jgi:hypothetical protein
MQEKKQGKSSTSSEANDSKTWLEEKISYRKRRTASNE